jgi:hypothetical protein
MIRLVHALAESDYGINIPFIEIDKFSILMSKFELNFADKHVDVIDISDQISLSHSRPETSIGKISRHLIFPSAITKYCRSIWKEDRKIRYSFQGLVTEKRKLLIEDWLGRNIRGKCRLPHTNSRLHKLRKRVLSKVGLDATVEVKIGDLLFLSSDRGRHFPIKAWDEQYFRVLANSEFVLCPGGDYIWSYRFFESILCGAIPVVEKSCEAYEGFRFFSFEDNAKNFKWCLDDAEFNYALCIEKLTISQDELNKEITEIIQQSS